jgi:hypothetical protein
MQRVTFIVISLGLVLVPACSHRGGVRTANRSPQTPTPQDREYDRIRGDANSFFLVDQCVSTEGSQDSARPTYQCVAHSKATHGKYSVTFHATLPTEKSERNKVGYITTSSRIYSAKKEESKTLELTPNGSQPFTVIFEGLELTRPTLGFGKEVIENIVGDPTWTVVNVESF